MNNRWETFANENRENISKAANTAKEILGDTAPDILKDNNALNSMLAALSDKDMEMLSEIIKNPALIKRILSSPKAMENLIKIMGK